MTNTGYFGRCGGQVGIYSDRISDAYYPILLVKGSDPSGEWDRSARLLLGNSAQLSAAAALARDKDLDRAISSTLLGKLATVLVEAKNSPSVSSENSANSDSKGSLGKGAKTNRNATDTRMWQCKVYCKSGSGPIIWKEVSAKSRREAATWVGDNADGICNASGQKYASSIAYPEYYCSEK